MNVHFSKYFFISRQKVLYIYCVYSCIHCIYVCMFCMLFFNFMYYIFLLLCMYRSRYCVSLCCSVYCLCVNVYCTTATEYQPNCSYQIHHIIYHTFHLSCLATVPPPPPLSPPPTPPLIVLCFNSSDTNSGIRNKGDVIFCLSWFAGSKWTY